MAYQALYRVWRSQRFEDVVGQKAITQTLKKCDRAKSNFACLFIYRSSGNRKNECCQNLCKSNQLSKTKSMESPAMNARCAVRSQLWYARRRYRNRRSQQQWGRRDPLLSETVQIMHQHKLNISLYIVDEVHMLSTGAFNALH